MPTRVLAPRGRRGSVAPVPSAARVLRSAAVQSDAGCGWGAIGVACAWAVCVAACGGAPARGTTRVASTDGGCPQDRSCSNAEERLAALESRLALLEGRFDAHRADEDRPADAGVPSPRDGAAARALVGDAALDVEALGELHYRVKRPSFDGLLAEPSELMRGARIVPATSNGRVTGLRLFGVRPGAVFARVGLRNGDEIRSVNEVSVASPDDALRAYKEVRGASVIRVGLVRAGRALELRIDVSE